MNLEEKYDEVEIKEEVGRRYQIALCELAKKRNSIICLPTGSGKTYIALQLTKFYLPDAFENNKKIVFLANTVPLVHQQAAYMRKQLFLELDNENRESHVTELTGDVNVDIWDEVKWKEVTYKTRIFVMTSQILLDAISHGFLSFKQINLLILDECHHTDKDHPMAKIMVKYAETKSADPNYDLPRVLGLTATIIRGNLKKDVDIHLEVLDIERRLCCKAVTYHDYEEVLRHSTKADVKMLEFTTCPPENTLAAKNIIPHMDETLHCIGLCSDILKPDMSAEIRKIGHSSLTHATQMYRKPRTTVDELTKILTDVKKIFDEESLGIYGGRLAASLRRGYLETMTSEEDSTENCLKIATDTCLAQVTGECDIMMGHFPKAQQIQTFISSKVKLLLDIFYKWQQEHGKKEELCGIVFCNERLTAQILTWIFKDAVEYCGDRYKFMKPGFVVGSSRFNNDLEEQRITTKKQEKTIKLFHKKDINLLFATNVLEEGLNVPGCNVVIRFDPILQYPSYVQSMGRARKRGALFGVLTSDKNFKSNMQRIDRFKSFNVQLANHLRNHACHVDEDDVDHEPRPCKDDNCWLAIDPSNPDSPKITLTDAVQLVHRYCKLLTCDRFVTMEPFSWWEIVGTVEGKNLYKAYVQLPSNAVFRDITEGTPQKSKNEAKRIAFLNVCKQLYKHGALDDRLFPRTRTLPDNVTNFLKEIEKQSGSFASSDESTKDMHWYPKKKPQCIERVYSSDEPLFVYAIKIKLLPSTFDSEEHLNLYNFDNRRQILAVLTKAVLTDIPPGYLYSRHGVLEFSYEKVNLKCPIANQDLAKIHGFQNYLFSKILKMNHHLVKETDDSPVHVCPLVLDDNGDWCLDNNLFTKLDDIDEKVFSTRISDVDRTNISLSMDEYENAVVVPWYKDLKEIEYYCVCSVKNEYKPDSPIDKNDPHSLTFSQYYSQRRSLKIMNPTKPFIAVASMGKPLNYLLKKKDQTKMSNDERKENKHSSSIQILIPEFVNIHPLPASLLVQARLLPSILHRTFRLLLAREIQISVAQMFNWRLAEQCKDGRGELEMNSTPVSLQNRYSNYDEISSKATHEPDGMAVTKITQELLSLANFGQLSLSERVCNGIPSQKATSQNKPCESESSEGGNIEKMHLDYVHPDKISAKHISCYTTWKSKRKHEVKSPYKDRAYESKIFAQKECSYRMQDINDIHFDDIDAPTDFSVTPGPTADAVMESITLANAQDAMSYENLEVIGDSFLKFCVSTHIFSEFPSQDEGAMTQLRTKLISNRHLFVAGSNKYLGHYLSGGIFIPETSWLPPGKKLSSAAVETAVALGKNFDIFDRLKISDIENMTTDELVDKIKNSDDLALCRTPAHTSFTHSRMGNKKVADCVEALIGVYYIHSGIDGALRLMDWVGLRAPNSVGESVKYKRPEAVTMPVVVPEDSVIKSPQQLLPLIHELEELIQYKFKDEWLVVEAFSHPGYLKNTVTGCYQRLEFLGDAVLDFLVTDHIYKYGLAKTPGALTDLRSALVNNITFGSLTVRYGFHKFLLIICKQLQDAVESFNIYQDENGHAVTGHFKLLNDLECPIAEDIEVPKVLGDLFESLAGAVYLDSNMCLNTTWKVFYRLMKNEIEQFGKVTPKAPIRELNEKFTGVVFRSYEDEENKYESRFQNYALVSVTIQQRTYFGRGSSKKLAKQAAAKFALRSIQG